MNLGLLEEEFSALDALPDSLYDVIITHTHGPLLTRARGILQWREKLLSGTLPEVEALCWPEESIRKTLLMRIETLELAAFCQGQESLTDSVLKDICAGVSSAEDYLAKTANKFNDKLAQRQKIKEKDSSFRAEDGLADHVQSRTPQSQPQDSGSSNNVTKNHTPLNKTGEQNHKPTEGKPQTALNHRQNDNPPSSNFSTDTPSRTHPLDGDKSANTQQAPDSSTTNEHARSNTCPAEEQAVNQLQNRWQSIANSWQQLDALDQQIEHASQQQKNNRQDALLTKGTNPTKSLPGRGWDLSTGLLTSQGWRDIIRYRQGIKKRPELIHFIDTIGREKKSGGGDKLTLLNNTPQALTLSKEQGKGRDGHKIPRKALEMDGIEHGDDINRMLPSELALLCHPVLKTLWHAKRAERLLLLYQHQGKRELGKSADGVLQRKGSPANHGKKGSSSLGRGPIIICLDTSGSMHGEPEHIAKACVLEALKIAHREQRPCHLFAFSGPQQTTCHQLDLRRGGLIELLKFLQFSFHGGTDFPQVLKLALQKQAEEGWEKSDILLVTDGRFPLDKKIIKNIEDNKKTRKLRVFGILTGSWQHKGIQAFCDDSLRFNG